MTIVKYEVFIVLYHENCYLVEGGIWCRESTGGIFPGEEQIFDW